MITEVEQYIKASFPGIWIQSNEHDEAIKQLITLCEAYGDWEIGYWDADVGLLGSAKLAQQRTEEDKKREPNWFDKKPVMLIKEMGNLAKKTKAQRTLFIMKNFHRKDYLENPTILQAVLNSLAAGKAADHVWCFIVMAPNVNIPAEWENDFVVVEHELPDKDQLWEIAQNIAEESELPKTEEDKQLILEAATGLTRRGAEGAFSLSIVNKRPFDPEVVQSLKSQAVKRRNVLTMYDGTSSFENLGGLENFKEMAMKILTHRASSEHARPKGFMLLGVPGAGKSEAVKCLGNATNRKVLQMDMGSLRSKYLGETDQNMRDALKLADSMAPCILFIDEIEKGLSGTQSSGVTDGGTTARVFGTFLTWLNDHKSDVFVIGTCNDISQLPPEFSRAERFDAVFFFDLPTKEERQKIWDIYIKMFHVKATDSVDKLLNMSEGWTGAEIRQCCRMSVMLEISLEQAAELVVPIVKTSDTSIERLRDWAEGRCIASSTKGIYRRRPIPIAT